MKVLVAGASGQTGRRVVQALKERGIEVRALVRQESSKEVLPPDTEIAIGDVLQPETLRSAMAGCTAVVSATGAAPSFDPTGPYKVDYEGTKNLVDIAKQSGIEQLVMVSSLCTSKFFHPLNLFWLILVWKKRAEEYLQSSGLAYTIVRPGGLKNEDNSDQIVMSSADTLFDGSIPRTKVAQVCAEALLQSAARNKIVEIVAKPDAAAQPIDALFASVG